MKNTYIKSFLIITLAVLSVSCNDNFLEKTPTQYVSLNDVAETGKIYPEVLKGTLRGLYTKMYTIGTGGTTSNEDFGQKAYDIYGDMLSGDMALSANSYSRYSALAQLQLTVDYTRTTGNYPTWRYYYRVIGAANFIIGALGGNDAPITDANKATMGQAKAMRAYAYFYLTQFYIPEYSPTSKYLPLYINSKGDPLPQSTTKEVYTQMIKDLNVAITLLDGFQRTEKYQINQDVAKGLLAYVYASMDTDEGDTKAKDLAESVINTNRYPLTTFEESTGGFNNVKTPSWMWGVDITSDASLSLTSWWGQMDYYTYSYQFVGDRKTIDKGLFNLIKPNDVRKTQFENDSNLKTYLMPLNKFYDPNKIPGNQRIIETDYIYMRIDELYLLSAEMSAKLGDVASAKTRLKEVLKQRFRNSADYAYIDALNGQALQDEIYLQTRIEFWGEGKSYLALKRNKGTVVRGSNHLYEVGVPIPYNDDRLTFDIPISEVQNNPSIKANN